MDAQHVRAEEQLKFWGAATIDHPGGTLLAHLRRVRDLLTEWGAADTVRLAGLCHAAYGTDGFLVALADWHGRSVLAHVIGEPAERLVYLYASCDRGEVYPQLGDDLVEFADRFTGARFCPDAAALAAFAEITAANEYDLMQHSPAIAGEHGAALRQLMRRARPHLSPAATRAWTTLSG